MKTKIVNQLFLMLTAIFIFNGMVLSDNPSTVTTPKGSVVNTTTRTYELDPEDIALARQYVQETFPEATIVWEASRKFNCHSFAWYNMSNSNDRWMNHPGDDTYWTDGSYVEVKSPTKPSSGDKVSYVNGDHSGIVDNSNGDIVSKWGEGCLVRHLVNRCPYAGDGVVRYYKHY
jgi:hypothetical protein